MLGYGNFWNALFQKDWNWILAENFSPTSAEATSNKVFKLKFELGWASYVTHGSYFLSSNIGLGYTNVGIISNGIWRVLLQSIR